MGEQTRASPMSLTCSLAHLFTRFCSGPDPSTRRLPGAQPLWRFAPVQLAAQHREVIVILRVEQSDPVLRPADDNAIAFGQRKARLPIAMQVRILASQEDDLDHH